MQRARSTDAKAQRTEDLLRAAEELALELGGVRHVTLAPVTERAGLHRTAVRRYFANKEDLLLELAERGWRQWRELVVRELGGRTDLGPREVAGVLTETLAVLPVFLDTLTHVTLSLEGDVPIDRARRYKTNSYIEHDKIVDALTKASTLTADQITALVPASASLAATFWQIANPSPSLVELYEQVPAWGHVVYDFEPKIRLLIESIALGLVQILSPDSAPGSRGR